MARLTADQWETIRAEREAGKSFPELAKKHGVSHQAIQKRAKNEGWGDGADIGVTVRRKVAEKVAGVVAGCNPKKKAEALEDAAAKDGNLLSSAKGTHFASTLLAVKAAPMVGVFMFSLSGMARAGICFALVRV